MTNPPEPTWLSLDELPRFANLVEGMLADTEEMAPLLLEAQEKPWVLDDATVQRAIRLYTERLDYLDLHQEQLARWRKDTLTRGQQREINRLDQQTAQNRTLVTQILDALDQIKDNTIEQILARDDAALAMDILTGKLKPPW